MSAHFLDATARAIFVTALVHDQAGELLEALFEGGSATVDAITGRLVIATSEQLDQMSPPVSEEST